MSFVDFATSAHSKRGRRGEHEYLGLSDPSQIAQAEKPYLEVRELCTA
jgi:hypothetical protein